MKKLVLATLMLATAGGAMAQAAHSAAAQKKKAAAEQKCDNCGTVQAVALEKRKGDGGAAGIVGGAVVGGVVGNQIGSGTTKTVATVGGAVVGGALGNEVQKRVTAKEVWVTRVAMKDGSVRTFEHETRPAWAVGNQVKVEGNTVTLR